MVDIVRDLKTINMLVIHCSDSDRPEDDNIDVIREWHISKNKWSDVGYHFFIDKKGKVFEGRPLNKAGAHCIGQNAKSIGICMSGKKEFWEQQFRSLNFLVVGLMRTYNIRKDRIYPHNHFNAAKSCPNFDIDKIWMFDGEKNK